MSLSKGFPTLMNFQGFQGFPNMTNKQPNISRNEDIDDISNIPNFQSNIEMNNKINIIDIDSDYEENKSSFTKKNLLVNHFANSMKSNTDINYDSEEKNNQSNSDEENIIESMNKRKEEIKKMSIMEGNNYKSKAKNNTLDYITNPKTHKTNIFQKWLDYHVKDNK